MCHKSKIDWCALAGIALTIGAVFLRASAWIAAPVLLILLLCAWPQSYETTPEGLVVRDALTRRLIPYQTIDSAAPGDWRGRVQIRYGASALAVAPADAGVFLNDLAQRAPHLVRRGDALVPRDRHAEYRFRSRTGRIRIGIGQG